MLMKKKDPRSGVITAVRTAAGGRTVTVHFDDDGHRETYTLPRDIAELR